MGLLSCLLFYAAILTSFSIGISYFSAIKTLWIIIIGCLFALLWLEKERAESATPHRKETKSMPLTANASLQTKVCVACCEMLTKENFSKKQWKSYKRRCKECIFANRYVSHENSIEIMDENDIELSVKRTLMLWKSYHAIEAERELTSSFEFSKQVLGRNHYLTKRVGDILNFMIAQRAVVIKCGGELKWFKAWSYGHEEDVYVVQDGKQLAESDQYDTGFIQKPMMFIDLLGRNKIHEDQGKLNDRHLPSLGISPVHPNNVFLALGTPVVCCGLKGSFSHLNGKIGDVRSSQPWRLSYVVHFEDPSLEPSPFTIDNIRILFNLPKKQ